MVQPTAEKKLEAPASRPATVKGSGTVRETPVDITVSGTTKVTVAAPQIMRVSMDPDTQKDLNKLTGANTNLRTEGASAENKYYGWFIHDININGTTYTGFDQMKQFDLAQVYFFNIDAPGIYYTYDYKYSEWSWGTWAIDKKMEYVAFDVETQGTRNNLWDISELTTGRMVLSLRKDIDKNGIDENIIIGLNGYDLRSSNNDGQMVISTLEQSFIGSWSFISADSNNVAKPFIPTDVLINSDGTALTKNYYADSTVTEYSNWIMEAITSDSAYLVTTYYEKNNFFYDKFSIKIVNNIMSLKVIATDNPDNIRSIGYNIGMAKK